MNETKTEWRDCADPDELAAAVAAGVEVEVQRRVGQPWQPTRSIDAAQFAGFISTGHRYRLPTSWRPEPPAPDELRERIARAMFDRDGFAVRWDEASVNTTARYSRLADAVLAVLPKPPDGCEAVFLPTDVVDHYVSAEPPAGRWERQASFVVNACREAQARRGTATTPPPVPPNPMVVREFAAKVADYVSTHQNADGMSKRGWAIEAVVQALEEPTASQEARSILAPTPPWPGAVLSGLVDEDGVPTWLAQAGQVRGEQARIWHGDVWNLADVWDHRAWVEVRAPRAVPAAPVTVTIPAETAHALLRYIEDGDYDTDYVIDRLADLLIAAMDGDQ